MSDVVDCGYCGKPTDSYDGICEACDDAWYAATDPMHPTDDVLDVCSDCGGPIDSLNDLCFDCYHAIHDLDGE